MAQESDEALLARIDALEAQNQELKGLVNDLKAELDATEKRLDEIEAAQSKAPAAGGAKGGGDGMSKKEKKAAAKAAAKAKEAAAPAGEKQLSKKEQKAADAKAEAEKAEKKAVAAATKEGGKKGQDLIGMSDLGGMKYFTVAMEKCQGRWDLLEAAMAGACKVVDEAGDDRKGGAGDLGVCFLSCDEKKDTKVIIHMNKDIQEALPIKEWAETMMADSGVQGRVLDVSEDGCTIKAATEAVNTHLAKTAKEVSSKAKEAAALAGALASNLATYHKEMGVMANLVKNVEPYKDHVKEVVRGLEAEEDSRIEALNMDVNKVGLGDTGDDIDMMG